jgi:hypothetical protein
MVARAFDQLAFGAEPELLIPALRRAMLLPQVVRTLPNPLFGNAFAAMRELLQRIDQFVLKLQEPLPRDGVSGQHG